jgi:foldase protein PrsA
MAKKNLIHRLKSEKFVLILAIVVIIAVLAFLFNFSKIFKSDNKSPSTVVATVNGEEITTHEFDSRYNLLKNNYPTQVISQEDFLEQLIEEKLLVQEAKKSGVTVSDDSVKTDIDKLISQSPVSKSDFESKLQAAGMTFEEFTGYYKNNIIVRSFLNSSVLNKIEVNDSEISDFYLKNKAEFTAKEGQIRARHILVKTEQEAKDIEQKLVEGEDFGELAKQYSIEPNAATSGGELGFFGKGQMVPEFEEAAFKLNVNAISDPVQTQFGWHIIQRESNTFTFEEAKELIRNILISGKQNDYIVSYVQGLKDKAKITRNMASIPTTAQTSPSTTTTPATADGSCIAKYGLTSDTVIFYHATWCPHCQKMEPIVTGLQQNGYSFQWVDSDNAQESAIVNDCFSDLIGQGVPEFICAGSRQIRMGEMEESDLKAFADSCKA